MNRLRAYTLLLSLPLALSVSLPAATPDRAEAFAEPARAYQAKFRWWWPHGLVDNDQIAAEVRAMAAAGFGGAEVADVHHSIYDQDLQADTHGWGTKPWVDALATALRTAQAEGMTLDLTIGPSWPAAVPTVTPDDPGAAKELAIGFSEGPFPGPVPAARVKLEPHVHKQDLMVVQAAVALEGDLKEKGKWVLDQSTLIDLSDRVQDGQLDWSAPDDRRWVVMAYWLRGYAQEPERGPHTEPASFVVDHFGMAGTQAIIDFWEAKILTPEIRELIPAAGGALFEDSIEFETDATLWTPTLFEEFQKRAGYDLKPFLPLVVQEHEKFIIEYAGVDANQIRHEFYRVFWDLYLDNHQRPLQQWAAKLGLKLRTQPYGLPTDAMKAAAELDISEGESLGFKNLDDYRCLAGARDMGGKTILSNEAAAYAGAAYAVTWKRVLATLNPIFAAGVNQTVLHGYAYAEAPGAKWPGFAAFSPYNRTNPGYAEAWGPRMPSWQHVEPIADYFARTQWVLQQGVPQLDVAFLRQEGYVSSGFGAPWFSKEGVTQGWTHNFITPALLELPSATVKKGRLAPEGPNYRLLVLEGNVFRGKSPTLPVATAEKLLEFAQAGLPIILIGDWSNPSTSDRPEADEEARLKAIFAQLLSQKTVKPVATREELGAAVSALGLERPVEHASVPFEHAHRRDGKVDYFFFANAGKEAASAEVSFRPSDRKAKPFLLDPWSGDVFALPPTVARRTGGGYTLPVELNSGDSKIIAFGPKNAFDDVKPLPVRGATVEKIQPVWQLEVEAWTPGATPPESTKTTRSVALPDGLKPWPELGLEDVSGLGRYTSTVTIPAEWRQGGTVTLQLGQLFDTAEVQVNGQTAHAVNPLNPVIDITSLIQPGVNTLTVEVSTTLNNQLRTANPDVFGRNGVQAYGLLGPVELFYSAQPSR